MNLLKHVLNALLRWPYLAIVRIVMIILGFFIVPLALLSVKIPKTVKKWELIRLPHWALLWDNVRDGAIGDRRLNFWTSGEQYPLFYDKLPFAHYIKAYHWLAFRNPTNYLTRYVQGCYIPDCKIALLAGQEFVSDTKHSYGYQFTHATDGDKNWYGFYWLKPIGNRVFRIRFGHKIEPRYITENWGNELDKAWKGYTFGVSWREERK